MQGDIPESAFMNVGAPFSWKEPTVKQSLIMYKASPIQHVGKITTPIFLAMSKFLF